MGLVRSDVMFKCIVSSPSICDVSGILMEVSMSVPGMGLMKGVAGMASNVLGAISGSSNTGPVGDVGNVLKGTKDAVGGLLQGVTQAIEFPKG